MRTGVHPPPCRRRCSDQSAACLADAANGCEAGRQNRAEFYGMGLGALPFRGTASFSEPPRSGKENQHASSRTYPCRPTARGAGTSSHRSAATRLTALEVPMQHAMATQPIPADPEPVEQVPFRRDYPVPQRLY